MSRRVVGSGLKPATIYDVATLSGVATSTVSRALSNPDRVSPATRDRVVAAANRVGYIPSRSARSLVSGRTNAVAVLVADITNPFYFDFVRGAQQQLNAVGYMQLLVDTEESAAVEAQHLARLGRAVDGVILAASRLSDEEIAAAATQLAIVTINRASPDVPSVFLDTPSGFAQAVDHLVSLGHQRIAYVGGPTTSFSDKARWDALAVAGERHHADVIRLGHFAPTLGVGAAAADAVLNSGVTACVAFNDLLAIGMLMRFRARGVQVPNDMSVVGCDDIFGASFCNPPLTTITAPIERAGRVAVDILHATLTGSPANNRMSEMLPTYLTIRESSGPAPNPHSAR
jgi:LacI family repressor for deo operon, udp, cdd, tsx, nupC, and nupG